MGLLAGTIFDRPPHCERCDKLESECTCPPLEPVRVPPAKQMARLGMEKRAKGKLVTTIRDLSAANNDLPSLLTKLKSTCGAGGTIEDEILVLQGDHRDRVETVLKGIGYRVRRV